MTPTDPNIIFSNLLQDGGFYSAEDADSLPTETCTKKKEGAFCVWTKQEILDVLSDMEGPEGVNIGELFCHHYDVQEGGNVDPYKVS